MEAKFDFYEIVKIKSNASNKVHLNNKTGYISGKAQENDDEWYYAVAIYDVDHLWCFDENELEFTGKFHDKESIKIVV